MDAKPLVAAAELHHAVLAFVVLSVAVRLLRRVILSLGFLGERGQAQSEPEVLMPAPDTASVAASPRGSASNFFALCLATCALLHVDQLVGAAADLGLNTGAVACVTVAVVALFDWTIFSLTIVVAREPSRHKPNVLLRPAASPGVPARPAFAVLATVVSASWFAESFFPAQLGLPSAANAITVMLFAALFNVSIHLFRSCF